MSAVERPTDGPDDPLLLADDAVADLVLAWASPLPPSRFSGSDPDTARISVTSAEAVDLAQRAYNLGRGAR